MSQKPADDRSRRRPKDQADAESDSSDAEAVSAFTCALSLH